jgi:ABC-type transport system substrate-binding protein
LLPVLRKNRNLVIEINDPVGNVGALVMNHLHPPFNDVRARRAILMALSQEDYMRAVDKAHVFASAKLTTNTYAHATKVAGAATVARQRLR